MWNGKQKRCYQRLMSGITFSNYTGKVIRFITLTTSRISTRDIHKDFRVLKMRIKRKFGEFEYIRIKTNEGNGVLHILYKGTFIPYTWLSRNWNDIHQSPIVDIRATSKIKGLGKYVVSQYLCDQRCSFLRYCWSWGWCYRGFVKYWKSICFYSLSHNQNAVDLWNLHLTGHTLNLNGKILKPPPDVSYMHRHQSVLDMDIFSQLNHIPIHFESLISRCGWLENGHSRSNVNSGAGKHNHNDFYDLSVYAL